MVDNGQELILESSQESLPLSQETFQCLNDELKSFETVNDGTLGNSHFNNITGNLNSFCAEVFPLESIESISVLIPKREVSSSSYAPSSLPASQNWAGPYNFEVSFGSQEKYAKGVSWTYSQLKDKLYVRKDAPCPINFSANTSVFDDVSIRVMALYTSPDHASEIVHRCVNHSMEELHNNIFEAEHLVRCESKMASYMVDHSSKRHSVAVPFEIPPMGQQYSTYIYKFACFGSCAGGPNRRAIMLIFSLEKDGVVMGRHRLDVKICACPGRDRKSDEEQLMQQQPLPKKRKGCEIVSLADMLEFTKTIVLPPTKKKVKKTHDKSYKIKADDKEQFDFLIQMKNFFNMSKSISNLHPEVKKALSLQTHRMHSQDEDSN